MNGFQALFEFVDTKFLKIFVSTPEIWGIKQILLF